MEKKLIEIKQEIPGYNNFIGSWLIKDDLTLIIDVGPSSTVKKLINSLESLDIEKLDAILLTHIHIDHAGGLAGILERYPMADVITHEKGINFLVDPSKLWEGSLDVLGKTAESYGCPEPVSKERLVPHTQSTIKNLEIIETPGHAAHHLSYSYKNLLFSGEAGGNYFTFKGAEYMRPATPHRFFYDVFLKSIDRLLELQDMTICYQHFGSAKSSRKMLGKFRSQLMLWKDVISKEMLYGEEHIEIRCLEALIDKDPDMKAYHMLDPDSRVRENTFITNSIKGFLGYLKENRT